MRLSGALQGVSQLVLFQRARSRPCYSGQSFIYIYEYIVCAMESKPKFIKCFFLPVFELASACHQPTKLILYEKIRNPKAKISQTLPKFLNFLYSALLRILGSQHCSI